MKTYGNWKAAYFFLILWPNFASYLLIFSVSYLETGLKMVFLQSDAYKWGRNFVYFMNLQFLAYFVGFYLAKTALLPVFRAAANATE